MSVTIVEALQNAEINLKNPVAEFQRQIGLMQLRNAIALLDKGWPSNTEVEPLLEKHGSAENVPPYGGVELAAK